MVELYLIRHGIAAERGIYANDNDRPLTSAGIQKTQQVARRLADLSLHFDHLLTSPLVRARQTANILHQQGLCSRLDQVDCLAPDGSLEVWLDWLAQQNTPDRIALVGHQPDLGWWAERLIWGQDRDALVLKKAGIIGVMLPDVTLPSMNGILGTGQLFWLTAPKLFL